MLNWYGIVSNKIGIATLQIICVGFTGVRITFN